MRQVHDPLGRLHAVVLGRHDLRRPQAAVVDAVRTSPRRPGRGAADSPPAPASSPPPRAALRVVGHGAGDQATRSSSCRSPRPGRGPAGRCRSRCWRSQLRPGEDAQDELGARRPAGTTRAMYLSGTKAPSRIVSSLRVARMPSDVPGLLDLVAGGVARHEGVHDLRVGGVRGVHGVDAQARPDRGQGAEHLVPAEAVAAVGPLGPARSREHREVVAPLGRARRRTPRPRRPPRGSTQGRVARAAGGRRRRPSSRGACSSPAPWPGRGRPAGAAPGRPRPGSGRGRPAPGDGDVEVARPRSSSKSSSKKRFSRSYVGARSPKALQQGV